MKKRIYCLLSSILVITVCLSSLAGCSKKETVVETTETEETLVEEEVVDEKIENADKYVTALGLLGFDEISLEKEYTPEELVVYLMKVFNIADKAISCDFQCPYDNVKDENKPVIAYAYASWLIKDVSTESINASDENTASIFVASLLRFMGYSDRNNEDFISSNAIEFAKSLGINYEGNTGKIRGDYLAKMLWNAMYSKCKDGILLIDMLIKDKIVRNSTFKEAENIFSDNKEKSNSSNTNSGKSGNSSSTYSSSNIGSNTNDSGVGTSSSDDYSGGTTGGGDSGGGGGTTGGGGDSGGGDDSGGGTTGGDDSGGGDSGGGDDSGGGGDSGGGTGENETEIVDF